MSEFAITDVIRLYVPMIELFKYLTSSNNATVKCAKAKAKRALSSALHSGTNIFLSLVPIHINLCNLSSTTYLPTYDHHTYILNPSQVALLLYKMQKMNTSNSFAVIISSILIADCADAATLSSCLSGFPNPRQWCILFISMTL